MNKRSGSKTKHRVIQVITSLELGGAQTMLYRLLADVQKTELEYSVITLIDKGKLGKSIEALGVPVYEVGMTQGYISFSAFWRLVKLLKQIQPDIIQGWTYHANVAASIAACLIPRRIPVIWSIHHSLDNLPSEKPLTRLLIRLGALISYHPVRIHYCSFASADQHETRGYASASRKVIPNGFDCAAFQPSYLARSKLRKALQITDDSILIGTAARYHPMKDQANFVLAARELAKYCSDVHFVMAGRNVDSDNQILADQIKDAGLNYKIHLLGERTDMCELLAGLDIFSTSSAWGESFPIIVGEAMACGVPCVVTDIGDSARMVGKTGIIVSPKDPNALAGAWRKLIEVGVDGRRLLGLEARKRIIDNYSLLTIVRQYETLYEEILA